MTSISLPSGKAEALVEALRHISRICKDRSEDARQRVDAIVEIADGAIEAAALSAPAPAPGAEDDLWAVKDDIQFELDSALEFADYPRAERMQRIMDHFKSVAISRLSSSPVGEMEDRAVAKTDALIDARDCMSRAADIFEYIGRAEEADRLRRSADCCRTALASSGGGRT